MAGCEMNRCLIGVIVAKYMLYILFLCGWGTGRDMWTTVMWQISWQCVGIPWKVWGLSSLYGPHLTLRLHQGMLLKVLSGRCDIRNFSLKNVNKFGKESSDFFQGSCREEILGLEHHILRLYYFYLY